MAELIMQNQVGEMAAKQTIPAGYKQTEVGIIPEDWNYGHLECVCPIGKKYGIVDGPFGSNLKTEHYRDSGIPIISSGFVTNGFFHADEYLYVDEDKFRQEKRSAVAPGDIVMAKIGARCGASAILPLEHEVGIISGNALKVTVNTNEHSTYFVWQHLWNKYLTGKLDDITATGAQPAISMPYLKKMLIPLPIKKEQIAIANALSDTDALIVGLEQLIAKKQAIKTATMQQLLTGRARLPQFALRPNGTPKGYKSSELGQLPEDWITPTLKDITSNIIDYRGRTPRKLGLEWGGGNILALSAGNVKKGFIDYEAECYFGSDELYKKWMTSGDASKDDIVFTMEAPLGNVALIPDEDKYILSQRTILLQLERSKFLPTFIIQVFLSDMFQSYISESATGSTAQGIKRSTFEKMFVAVPSCLEEQTAIAQILTDMDSELTALEQKLTKARDVKQGMMQQLLTGRIRLPLPQEA
ncbi:restriction endonuclease subunit S [Aeromonas hydrophila]